MMLAKFREWSVDAISMLLPDVPDFCMSTNDPLFTSVFRACENSQITVNVLGNIMTSFNIVTERQLADFLPDGK